MYNPFLNKKAGDTFTYYILEKLNQYWKKVVQVIWYGYKQNKEG